MPRLVITSGPNQGQALPIPAGGAITVGRDKKASLKITDLMSSRQHFKVESRGAGFHITDLNSRNGTFVNGTRILDRPLQPGDEIRVGETRFALEVEGAAATPQVRINAPSSAAPAAAPRAPRKKVVYDTSDAHAGESIFSRLFNGLLTVGLLVGLVYGGWWAYDTFINMPPEEDPAGNDFPPMAGIRTPDTGTPDPSPGGGSTKTPDPAPDTTPVAPPGRAVTADVREATTGLNRLVLAKEMHRLLGNGTAARRMEVSAGIAHARLDTVGEDEYVPDHLQPGDTLLAVGDIILEQMPPAKAAEFIRRNMKEMPPRGDTRRLFVKRAGEPTELFVFFPGAMNLPTATEVAAASKEGGAKRVPLPPAIKQEIRSKVIGMHEYYQRTYMSESERKRFDDILGRGEATEDEYIFLQQRILRGVVSDVRQEQDWFALQLRELRDKIDSRPPPDMVLMKTGKTVQGSVTKNGDGTVTVASEFGRVRLNESDIKNIQTGQQVNQDFLHRLNATFKFPQAFGESLVWTRERGLTTHLRLLGYTMLQRDPVHREARIAAGYTESLTGRWELEETVGGRPSTAGIRPTRAELKTRLEALGFFYLEGKWYRRDAWSWQIDSLWKTRGTLWRTENVAMKEFWEQVTRYSILGAGPGFFNNIQRNNGPRNLRFLAPNKGTGKVTIPVSAPGPILECSIRAVGEIHERDEHGTITVAVAPSGGGDAQVLYTIKGGRNDDYHDVTATVKEQSRFAVIASITEVPKKGPNNSNTFSWHARFLPSVTGRPGQISVLHVKGYVAKPAPEVDKQWAAAR